MMITVISVVFPREIILSIEDVRYFNTFEGEEKKEDFTLLLILKIVVYFIFH